MIYWLIFKNKFDVENDWDFENTWQVIGDDEDGSEIGPDHD